MLGFGFVQFDDLESASGAVAEMNMKLIVGNYDLLTSVYCSL